jgi:divalent metal cation (Fe/Co/Zn/Cd) transporter
MGAVTMATTKAGWTRWAVGLAALTISWNLVEGSVATAYGVADESLALFGFGADAFVELGAASLVLWRLSAEARGDVAVGGRREKLATRAIGALLTALAIGVAIGSIAQLATGSHPEAMGVGVVLASLSIVLMVGLWRAKVIVARALDSGTLRADAACSLACLQLSVVLLLGSAIYAVAPALWWVDAVAALGLAGLIGREGIGTIRASYAPDATGCGCAH